MGRSRRWLCILLASLLLVGCGNGSTNQVSNSNGERNTQNIGTLTVYAPEKYRPALQQVFSHLNLAQNDFRVSWSRDFQTADVVVVENLPPEEQENYRILNPEKLQLQGIEQLTVRSSQGVVGLPLFLQISGFWYDGLLYDDSGIAPPQSINAWEASPLKEQYPIVCDEADMGALFWTVVAPYYLKNGGSVQDLATVKFQRGPLLEALTVLDGMVQSQTFQLKENAWQAFTANQAAYWIAGVDQVAAVYNHQSNRSTWKLSGSLAFDAQEQAVCVARADVLAVRKTSDPGLTDRFLERLYTHQILADLSAYSRMPLACRMRYAPGTVPELPQVCYTQLSSPSLQIEQVPCLWSGENIQQVYDLLLSLVKGDIAISKAAEAMLQMK